MVSQDQGERRDDSKTRILAAAEEEFAARGFDGAKVDRIAARARVNKAMLYYHFGSKLALYRAILTSRFTGLAAAVEAERGHGDGPQDELRRFIRAIAREASSRPHFPAIWLREMAEGGRHLTPAVIEQLGAILSALGAVLAKGERSRAFRAAHPFVVQAGIAGPLLMFMASAPIRERFSRALPAGASRVTQAAIVDHVEAMTLAALERRPSATAGNSRRKRP